MKFELGDLIRLKEGHKIQEVLKDSSAFGIVISEGSLKFAFTNDRGERMEFWTYDVIIGEKRIENVPEEVLEHFEEKKSKGES